MSKKEEAFRLFDEGKKPSDPEVKSLGLSTKTRYNYYQEWKKQQDGSTGVTEIQELKQEKARLTLISQIQELEAKRERLPERVTRLEKQLREMARWMDGDSFTVNKNLSLFSKWKPADQQRRIGRYHFLQDQLHKQSRPMQK